MRYLFLFFVMMVWAPLSAFEDGSKIYLKSDQIALSDKGMYIFLGEEGSYHKIEIPRINHDVQGLYILSEVLRE